MATFLEIAQFTEDEAREYLERVRWPEGPVCPHCGDTERSKALKGEAHRPGLFKCYSCRKQFTVTVGTVMHRSRTPLKKWLLAFHMIAASKKGISALQLQRMLKIGSYQTAWHMAHRIRLAMREQPLAGLLSGVVEADETYIGGKRKGVRPGRPGKDSHKTPVFVLVERNGRVRARAVPNVTGKTLKAAIREHVDTRSVIMTDEYGSYNGLDREFGGHFRVRHKAGEYARDGAHVNTAESFNGLLKRGVVGAFHNISRRHLDLYLDEFAFRWNSRDMSDETRTALAIQGADGKRLTYNMPTS